MTLLRKGEDSTTYSSYGGQSSCLFFVRGQLSCLFEIYDILIFFNKKYIINLVNIAIPSFIKIFLLHNLYQTSLFFFFKFQKKIKKKKKKKKKKK